MYLSPNRRSDGSLLATCLSALAILVSLAGAPVMSQELEGLDDGDDGDLLEGALLDLDDLKGEARATAIRKLCEDLDEDSVLALVGVFARDRDPDSTKSFVLRALCDRGGPLLFEPAAELAESMDERQATAGMTLLGHCRDPRALRILLRGLRSHAAATRSAAVRSLGVFGDSKAVRALLPLARKRSSNPRRPRPEIRDEAVLSLVKLGRADALTWITGVYEEISEQIEQFDRTENWARHHTPARDFHLSTMRAQQKREFIARVTATFESLPEALVPAFVQLVANWKGERIVSFLAERLPGLVRKDNAGHFLPLLDYDSRPLMQRTADCLYELEDPVLAARVTAKLRAFRRSPDVQQRLFALDNWARLGEAEARQFVVASLTDPSRWVRVEAAKRARQLNLVEAAPVVAKLAASEEDEQLRWIYHTILRRVGRSGRRR